MSSNPCQYTENEIKTRAYYLKMENYGKNDEDRYFIAQQITARLCDEECKELSFDVEKHTCIFCDCRYGTIKTPYLSNHICWSCYWHHSQEQLTKMYEETTFGSINNMSISNMTNNKH